jgi:hypothetical protein
LIENLEGHAGQRELPPEDPIGRMIQAFNLAVQNHTEFQPDGTTGKRIVEVTCAVIESMKSRRTARVGEVLRLT